MTGETEPDEIYCRSCGEVIKRRAEICPECGVRNEAAEGTGGLRTMEWIYCRSCGDRIRREAEICPDCGVRNPLADAASGAGGPAPTGGGGGGTGTPTHTGGSTGHAHGGSPTHGGPSGQGGGETTPARGHDPSRYTTSASDNWVWGVGASLALWVLAFALPAEGGLAGLVLLVAWGLLPASVYFDGKWVRANTYWDPNLPVWILGSLVPLVNVLVGLVYLLRRRDADRAEVADDEPEDDALAELRRRYSRGEIDESQFEARVERILETEDRETARRLVENSGESTTRADRTTGGNVQTAPTRTNRETEE